jgi:hypothetical protein
MLQGNLIIDFTDFRSRSNENAGEEDAIEQLSSYLRLGDPLECEHALLWQAAEKGRQRGRRRDKTGGVPSGVR